MPTIYQWLSDYGQSHINETNKTIHWVCVPIIFFCLTGLLYCIKLPFSIGQVPGNVAMLVVLFVTLYYLYLSRTLWMGMLIFSCICLFLSYLMETYLSIPLWLICVMLFILAWVGQFYGHKVEEKKPAFLKDVQFLMIGPAWLMSFIYRKLGIGL